jgi:hypothetical protein
MAIFVVLNKAFSILMDFSKGAKGTIKEKKDRQKLKDQLLEQVKATEPNKRWNRSKMLLAVIDEIIYKATDRGFSFNGIESALMKKFDCSRSTVNRAIKILKDSGLFVVAYRENPNSNGIKTPVIILKSHPNYQYIMEILQIEDYKESVKETVENAQNVTGSKVKDDFLGSTNLSQEKDFFTENIKNNDEEKFFSDLNFLSSLYLSKDRTHAKTLIERNPMVHITIKQNSRKIVQELPAEFSKLDWTVFQDLMLSQLKRKQPLKPVGYVVKAFYKNKVMLAEKLDLSLENEYVPKNLLPKSFTYLRRIQEIKVKMENYRKSNNMEMVRACEQTIANYERQAGFSKCVVQNFSV